MSLLVCVCVSSLMCAIYEKSTDRLSMAYLVEAGGYVCVSGCADASAVSGR